MLRLDEMERLIRVYFDGCNEADVTKMTSCFVPGATHYFPPGMYGGPFVGAETIAHRWVQAVENLGSHWTIDNFVGDASQGVAVIEWSHFKRKVGTVLRGDEWYRFDPETGLITEIRAYYAAAQDTSVTASQLDGFDYAGRGYAMAAPPLEPKD